MKVIVTRTSRPRSEVWQIIYIDLMTQIMMFFVILWSIGQLSSHAKGVSKSVGDETVHMVTLPGDVLFPSGKSKLSPDGEAVFGKLFQDSTGEVLNFDTGGLTRRVLVVHGHTDGEAPPIAWAAATAGLIGMTIGTLYQKRFGGSIEWRTGFFIQYVAAASLFALAALATETLRVQWTVEFLAAITWLVFGLSLGAIWLLYFLIRHQAAARVLSLFYLTPPFTALMAWLMFDEQLSPLALAGMAVCVAGVALVNWRAGEARLQ